MLNKELSKTGLLVTIGLLIITWVVTIWLFHYLTNPQTRPETFGFTLAFICFLEFLSFGYFAGLFIPNFREGVVQALYPVIGMIVGLYVALSMAIIIAYNLFSIFVSSPKAYFTTLTVESLVFLIILGSIIVLNAYRKKEDTGMEKEGEELIDISLKVQEIYQNFLNCKEFFAIQDFRDVETSVRKLKEKFQFCTPFGRSNSGVADLEEKIQNQIVSLGKLVSTIHSSKEEELGELLENIKYLTAIILQAMERREKLLIK